MVSPHPTYSPRGTPISVLNRCRALSALGHQVDLVTYGIGEDVAVPGLRYLRAPVPAIRAVKVGPSLAKVPLDLAVFARTAAVLARSRRSYDVLHTHEEAGVLGSWSRRATGLPHVYDMGNDLSVVMTNYGYSRKHLATRMASRIEGGVVSRADVVIAHFTAIAKRVCEITGDPRRAVVVPNVAVEPEADPRITAALRAQWSYDGMPIALYTGTLERYQGLDLIVDAVRDLAQGGTPARLVVVGGQPEQQSALRTQADALQLGNRVRVAGTLPPHVIPSALQAADVLVSPRAAGSNTPLKVFSYMASGRPILATKIHSHTQILDATTAVLVDPEPAALAAGLAQLLADPAAAAAMGRRARELAEASYGFAEYIRAVAEAYSRVGGDSLGGTEVDSAVANLRAQLSMSDGGPSRGLAGIEPDGVSAV